MACRETAAVFNLSCFAKIILSGPDARWALERICTADIDKPTDSFVYKCCLGDTPFKNNFLILQSCLFMCFE